MMSASFRYSMIRNSNIYSINKKTKIDN